MEYRNSHLDSKRNVSKATVITDRVEWRLIVFHIPLSHGYEGIDNIFARKIANVPQVYQIEKPHKIVVLHLPFCDGLICDARWSYNNYHRLCTQIFILGPQTALDGGTKWDVSTKIECMRANKRESEREREKVRQQ